LIKCKTPELPFSSGLLCYQYSFLLFFNLKEIFLLTFFHKDKVIYNTMQYLIPAFLL
jgi:hypothetical protein